MTLGESIKKRRAAAGLTQDEVGKRLGISGSAVGQFEKKDANPSMNTLRKLAWVMGCDVEDFLEDVTLDNAPGNTDDDKIRLTHDETQLILRYRGLPAIVRTALRAATQASYDEMTKED